MPIAFHPTLFVCLPCRDSAFDEFQEVAKYTDGKAEATLRSYIQHLNNVQFIFAGSKKHMMMEMFSSPARPFPDFGVAAPKINLG